MSRCHDCLDDECETEPCTVWIPRYVGVNDPPCDPHRMRLCEECIINREDFGYQVDCDN